MTVLTPTDFPDYELLDSGEGLRLERFGPLASGYVLIRPDPQAIWKKRLPETEWNKADVIYDPESNRGTTTMKGGWVFKKPIPKKWILEYQDISFYCKLSPFKHTGIFPEQAVHWEWIVSKIEARDQRLVKKQTSLQPLSSKQLNILNLFAYTGISSLVAAKAGAKVTHVDGSFPTIGWAKENDLLTRSKEPDFELLPKDNQSLSKLPDPPTGGSIRWILDDCLKFCQREVRRGVKYDGIIMDPPIYGHGPKGETWDFNTHFPKLMELASSLLTSNPLFFIVNAYAISASSIMLENVLKDYLPNGTIESGELALKDRSGRLLSTGIFARWIKS